MLNVVMLSYYADLFMLSVTMPKVVMVSVVAPLKHLLWSFYPWRKKKNLQNGLLIVPFSLHLQT
jgi:hypothetical protein